MIQPLLGNRSFGNFSFGNRTSIAFIFAAMTLWAAGTNAVLAQVQYLDVRSITLSPDNNLRFGIQNVTEGIVDTDAANIGQLRRATHNVEGTANQGVAAVAAMATCIRTPDPGKSTVSVGGGYYGGQAATAMSVAHRSRSGKLQGVAAIGVPVSMVSGGNIAASGAIGWQF